MEKIAQSDLLPGDVILMGKNSTLLIARVLGLTKSGSVRYEFSSSQTDQDHYYDFREDNQTWDKKAYIAKPWKPEYQRYFGLLYRKDGAGSN